MTNWTVTLWVRLDDGAEKVLYREDFETEELAKIQAWAAHEGFREEYAPRDLSITLFRKGEPK